MSNDRSEEERTAQERLIKETEKHFKGSGTASNLTTALSDLVRTRGAREGIDEERRKALDAAITALGEAMSGPPEAPSPIPKPESDDIFEQVGMKRPEQLRAELKVLQEQSQKTRRVMEGLIPVVGDIKRSTQLPEAAPVLERVNAALSNMMHESMSPGGVNTSRFHQPTLQLGDVHHDLQSVDSIEVLNRLRQDRLYPNLLKIRQILLEGHAMIARPAMGHISALPNANLVYVLGGDVTRAELKPIMQRLGLTMPNLRRGAEEALNRWQDMLDAYVIVCDFARSEPGMRAAVAYQLGWARTLGRPIVILTEVGQKLPFDIDIEPVPVGDAEAIEAAVLDALFIPQRSGIDRTASRRTVDELGGLYGGHSSIYVKEGLRLLLDEDDDVDDGVIYDRIRSLLSLVSDDRPDLVTPAWPPAYPPAGEVTMFHVMPFHAGWSKSVQDAARKGAGSAYRRHDQVASEHIIRSLWDEIAAASHVLVDITGLNDNVLIELGMAHALGKTTRIVAQDHVDLDQLHPVLRYWRVWSYRSDRPSTITHIVKDFVSD